MNLVSHGSDYSTDMLTKTVNMFSYGSNLHLQRMRSRAPSAVPAAIGYVRAHRIAFHKRSIDGSAKANVQFTAAVSDRVWGVIYRITAAQLSILDKYEFLGIGYNRHWTKVITNKGASVAAWMYVALPCTIDRSIRPYSWYLEYVVRGAYQHRLPLCYITSLQAVESDVDPNSIRDSANRHIIKSEAKCAPSTKRFHE